MSTRAVQYLKKKKIAFEEAVYTHEVKGAKFAAGAIGFPLEKTIKTLVAELTDSNGKTLHALALMPGDRHLSLKKLAKTLSVKKGQMAEPAVAERLTGYLTGGISPFGTTRQMPVVMDASLLPHDKIAINAGKRGHMLLMDPKDIVNAVQAKAADISS